MSHPQMIWVLIGGLCWLLSGWYYQVYRAGFGIIIWLVIAFDFFLLGPISIVPIIICLVALPRPDWD